jgi:hypothetical protein
MKRLLMLLTLAAFVASATMVVAADQPQAPGQKPEAKPTVNCCVKGDCKQVASDTDCAKAGGKVVKDCKECK